MRKLYFKYSFYRMHLSINNKDCIEKKRPELWININFFVKDLFFLKPFSMLFSAPFEEQFS